MGVWKERAYVASSILICSVAVILGTLFYPIVFLFFSLVALLHPLFLHGSPGRPPSNQAPPEGSGA